MQNKKIGIISDTHGDIAGVVAIMKKQGKLDFIIHLGDCVGDGEAIETCLGIEVIGVKGNCDVYSKLPEDKLLVVGDKKIFITHGHKYDVKVTYHKLFYKGLEVGADVVIFGHTHIATQFIEEEMLLMNPGSSSFPRINDKKTCGLLEIGENITGTILDIS